jgi:hypothetical protein
MMWTMYVYVFKTGLGLCLYGSVFMNIAVGMPLRKKKSFYREFGIEVPM